MPVPGEPGARPQSGAPQPLPSPSTMGHTLASGRTCSIYKNTGRGGESWKGSRLLEDILELN